MSSESEGDDSEDALPVDHRTERDSGTRTLSDLLLPSVVRRRLLARVILVLVVVIALNAAIVGYFYVTINDDLDRQVNRQVEATTTVHANVYDLWFERQKDETAEVANQQFSGLDNEEISAILRDERIRNEHVRHYHYVSVDTGRVEASSNPTVIGENILDRGVEREILSQEGFVLGERFTTVGDDPGIAIGDGVPFVQFIIIAEIDTQSATPTLEQPVRGGSTNVIHADGGTLVGNLSEPPPETLGEGVTVTSTDDAIVAYHPLSTEAPIYVVTRTPRESAFSIQNAVLRSFIVTIVLTFAILATATVVGGRSTLAAIRTLAMRAESMGRGNLDTALDVERSDEIGVLYTQFDQMRRRLKERIEETERLNYQLQVTDRMLRHNLTNDMNVIQLTAEMIRDDIADSPEDEAQVIIEKCEALLAKTDKQREITSILSTKETDQPIEIVEELEQVIDTIETTHPGADVTSQAPPEATVLGTTQLARAFQELIENGIVHNESSCPEVVVRVSEQQSSVVVEVEDSGPGIPEIEQPVLLGNTEIDQLNHGSGIGLWLVYWIVDQSNGSLEYEETVHGSIVRIELPVP